MADLLLFYPLDAWLAVVAAKVPIGLLAGLPGVGGGIVAVVRPHPGIDLIGGCDRHVRALAIALKLGTGDRPVIYQARSMFFLAHDLGASSGRRRHPVVPAAPSLPALFVAPASALVGTPAGRALAPPVCLVPRGRGDPLLLRA